MFNVAVRSRGVLPRFPSAALLLLGVSAASSADSPPPKAENAPQPAALSSDTSVLLPEAVDLETLGEQRAREGLTFAQLGNIDAQIDLRDNQVVGANSGHNILAEHAFDGSQGIFTIIQNSGHNVAIQESLIINIAVNP